jgi:hypothetical protein
MNTKKTKWMRDIEADAYNMGIRNIATRINGHIKLYGTLYEKQIGPVVFGSTPSSNVKGLVQSTIKSALAKQPELFTILEGRSKKMKKSKEKLTKKSFKLIDVPAKTEKPRKMTKAENIELGYARLKAWRLQKASGF